MTDLCSLSPAKNTPHDRWQSLTIRLPLWHSECQTPLLAAGISRTISGKEVIALDFREHDVDVYAFDAD
jgi:hypothetical protein